LSGVAVGFPWNLSTCRSVEDKEADFTWWSLLIH